MNNLVRASFGYDADVVSAATALVMPVDEESLTLQSDAEDADINTLIKRFRLTGEIPVVERTPLDLNLPEGFDFKMAMDIVNEGTRAFMELPADSRDRFNNDPAKFVDFALKPDNLDDMIKLGMASKAVVPPKVATLDDVVEAVKASKVVV
ncbi:MAG: internal scaffolding protein [Microvirus sp.]|nr:MAG: internal scaffolding protein [Microvirus sp.]